MMNREIKFRFVWKRPLEWAGPYSPDDSLVKASYLSLRDLERGVSIKPHDPSDFKTCNYTILVARQEYTGQKDMDDNDIYEGDRVHYSGLDGTVVFNEVNSSFLVFMDGKQRVRYQSLSRTRKAQIRIIGNINE